MKDFEYTQRVNSVIKDFRSISTNDYGTILLLADFMKSNYDNGDDDIANIYYDAISIVCQEHMKKEGGF